jgi:hypothetical protein
MQLFGIKTETLADLTRHAQDLVVNLKLHEQSEVAELSRAQVAIPLGVLVPVIPLALALWSETALA